MLRELVVPVKIAPGHRDGNAHLRQVHAAAGCGRPVSLRVVCPDHGELEPAEVGKAFEPTPDVLVPVTAEELEAVSYPASRTIDLSFVVADADIDPFLVERLYHLLPDTAERGYALLAHTLAHGALAAVGRFGAWNGEQLCAVAPAPGCARQLVLRILRPAEDLVPVDDVEKALRLVTFTEEEYDLARQLAGKLTRKRVAPLLVSDQRTRAGMLLEAKLAGGEVQLPARRSATAPPLPSIDVAAALRASL